MQAAFAALKTDGYVCMHRCMRMCVCVHAPVQAAFAALKTDGSVVAWGDHNAGGSTALVSNVHIHIHMHGSTALVSNVHIHMHTHASASAYTYIISTALVSNVHSQTYIRMHLHLRTRTHT